MNQPRLIAFFCSVATSVAAHSSEPARSAADVRLLISPLNHRDSSIRIDSSIQLAWRGAEATEATPILIKLMADQDVSVRHWAAYALTQIAQRDQSRKIIRSGKTVDPLLVCLSLLRATQPCTVSNVDLLVAIAVSRDSRRSQGTLTGLSTLRKELAIPAMANALGVENDSARVRIIVRGISRLAPVAEAAVPSLIKIASDRSWFRLPSAPSTAFGEPSIGDLAIYCLVDIGSPAALPLSNVMADRTLEITVRRSAAWGLSLLGERSAPAVDTVRTVLKESDIELRRECLIVLGNIGSKAETATSDVVAALKDKSPEIRVQAALTLFSIQPSNRLSVSTLTAAVSDKDPHVRWLAAKSLTTIGPPAKEAVSSLVLLLSDDNVDNRLETIRALKRIGVGAKGALQSLERSSLQDNDRRVREAASKAVAAIKSQLERR